jgi:hypothetical protein
VDPCAGSGEGQQPFTLLDQGVTIRRGKGCEGIDLQDGSAVPPYDFPGTLHEPIDQQGAFGEDPLTMRITDNTGAVGMREQGVVVFRQEADGSRGVRVGSGRIRQIEECRARRLSTSPDPSSICVICVICVSA